jgi:hypothetical protein
MVADALQIIASYNCNIRYRGALQNLTAVAGSKFWLTIIELIDFQRPWNSASSLQAFMNFNVLECWLVQNAAKFLRLKRVCQLKWGYFVTLMQCIYARTHTHTHARTQSVTNLKSRSGQPSLKALRVGDRRQIGWHWNRYQKMFRAEDWIKESRCEEVSSKVPMPNTDGATIMAPQLLFDDAINTTMELSAC